MSKGKYMKRFLFCLLFCALLISCGNKAITDDCGCFLDYDQAISYASKKNKPMLVFFTSAGDDEESTVLVNSIMKNASFKKEIASEYVVLHVDFSQDAFQKTVAADDATAQEQELANTYTNILQNNYKLAILFNISQMPGIFLCTSQGYVVTRLDSDTIFTNLTDLKKSLAANKSELNRFNSYVAATNKGSSVKKIEAIDTLYNATDSDYKSFLYPLVKYACELDPQNESGLLGKFIFAQAEIEAIFAYSQGDVENAVKIYLVAANNQYVKAEQKQECFFNAAYLIAYSDTDDYEGIISYLQTAYDIAPQSSKAESIKAAIEYFETVLEKSADYDGDEE